jgi:hypothetical protein
VPVRVHIFWECHVESSARDNRTICGLVFGIADVGIMLPMSFPDKKAGI